MISWTRLRVCDSRLCAPIADVEVSAIDFHGRTLAHWYSDAEGRLSEALPEGCDHLTFFHSRYAPKKIDVDRLPDSKIRMLELDVVFGYQDRLSYAPGDLVKVYIHASVPLDIALCRHGLEKVVVQRWPGHPACLQEVPDDDFVAGGLGWKVSLEYTIPGDALPGLYSLLLSPDGGPPHAIPMVVETPSGRRGERTRLLVLASTNTWQCYNIWGGRSRYRSYEHQESPDFVAPSSRVSWRRRIRRMLAKQWPDALIALQALKARVRPPDVEVAPHWALKPLSVHRPNMGCNLEGDTPLESFTNHLAAGEWRVLAWLEREGFEYDYLSEATLHWDPAALGSYDAVILSTHSEYWSAPMYRALERHHREHGLWILNISGNSIHGQVDLEADGALRLVHPNFDHSYTDKSTLIGVRTFMPDYGSCTGFHAQEPGHWAFGGTGVTHSSPVFGVESLNQNTPPLTARYDPGRLGRPEGLSGVGASGWEVDRRTAYTPRDAVVLARGLNPDFGADLLLREPGGTRGGLFSVSSITFGGALLVDEPTSGLCRNVLHRALSG